MRIGLYELVCIVSFYFSDQLLFFFYLLTNFMFQRILSTTFIQDHPVTFGDLHQMLEKEKRGQSGHQLQFNLHSGGPESVTGPDLTVLLIDIPLQLAHRTALMSKIYNAFLN